jgi:ABC-type nickel/cobalt efflux system permease component RcnA
MTRLVILLLVVIAALLPISPPAGAQITPSPATESTGPRIDPSKLIVRPKNAKATAAVAPSIFADPVGWIRVKQQAFYEKMSAALKDMRGPSQWAAAWSLMAMSFAYGVLHAAGPGHGKAVVSAWLLANEREVKRGILIACLSAVFQALTAIVLVSVLLMTVQAAGATAKGLAGTLESASYALIALLGLYVIAQAFRTAPAAFAMQPAGHAHHHQQQQHVHHDEAHAGCACGHSHMPEARAVAGDWSLAKAVSLAFAVGLRPCTGAILALLFSSAIGLYWAGIASTFAMALGTAMTVSAIAVLAVSSRRLALRLAGRDSRWLSVSVFGLKLAGGLVIAGLGGLLFWASLAGGPGVS